MMIILRTRCGCERKEEMTTLAHELIVPLVRPAAGHADEVRLMELERDGDAISVKRKPVEFDQRRFRLQPRRDPLNKHETPVYLEVP